MDYVDYQKLESIERRWAYPINPKSAFTGEAQRDIHTLIDMIYYQSKIIAARDKELSNYFLSSEENREVAK